MKKIGVCIYFMLIISSLISLSSANSPYQQNVNLNEGYSIRFPEQGLIKANENYTFSFYVFNMTNGFPINDSLTSCRFNLFDNYGNDLINNLINNDGLNKWSILVLSSNFSNEGEYTYIIQCNSSDSGGFESVGFTVSNKKQDIQIGESLLYVILTLAVLSFFLLILYFAIAVPYSNKLNESGAVIKVTKTKYIKLFLIALSYILFLWFLNVLIGVSDNFVSLTMYYGYVAFLFDIMNRGSIAFLIFIFILFIFEIIKDAKLNKLMSMWGNSKNV